jgi:hypothetical protein
MNEPTKEPTKEQKEALEEMVRLNQEMGLYDLDKEGSKPKEENKRV